MHGVALKQGYRYALTGAAFGLIVGLELARPLRPARASKALRTVRNLVIAVLGGVTVQLLERPLTDPLARRTARRRSGLVPALGLPPPVADALAVALLDFTLYAWHILTHRMPLLWRFHSVHHADPDLDWSTALRFHFGELALSVPWRLGQVALIGPSPRALAIWRRALLASILFHHSNIRLPARLERWLSWLVTTPRLHGIHHSVKPDERDTNWSSGLTLWDRLFGTFKGDVAQRAITIGVARLSAPELQPVRSMLSLPFTLPRRQLPP